MVTDWANKEKGSRQLAINSVKKREFRMVSSSIQFAFGPLDALPHGGVQVRCLLQLLEPMRGVAVSPFEHEIDQGHLHEWRLVLLQRVHNSLVHLGLPAVAAESIESRQAYIHARVVAQGVKEGRKYLWIELLVAGAPSDALEPRAGRLLLQHGKHDQLLHAGEFRLHGNQVWGRRLRGSQAKSGENADGEQRGAPRHGPDGRTKPMEHVPVPGGSLFSRMRVIRRLIRTTRLVRLQHRLKTRARLRAWLVDGQKRKLSPNDHFFGAFRALFEVGFDVSVLLAAQPPLQVIWQEFRYLFTLHGDLLEEECSLQLPLRLSSASCRA